MSSTTAIAAAVLAAGFAARADSVADEADFHFHRGAQLIQRGKVEEALGEFFFSNRLVHNRNVVFNIARSFELLKRYNEAYRWYSDILSEENVPAADRKAVETAIRHLEPSLALLRIESDPAGATLYIDRKDLGARGQTPLTLALPPGQAVVMAELAGHRPARADVTLAIGATRTVKLQPERIWSVLELSGEPGTAELRVDSTDGPSQGARGTLRVLPGDHQLFLSAPGHVGQQIAVQAAADETVPVHFKLLPLPPPSGSIVVRANVESALLRIDGREAGFAPEVIRGVAAGAHQLEVFAPECEPFTQPVVVRDGEQTFVDLKLQYRRPRVIAAERQLTRAEDAPASVTIISAEEIHAFGYATLAEALRSVRGLYATSDRSYQSLGVRGFSPPGVYNNKVLVLSDGHVTNDMTSGQGFIGRDFDVDLGDVERIEVVRGPGSVLYGSAAFFAVVNVVHRAAPDGQHFEGGAMVGSLAETSGAILGSLAGSGNSLSARAAGLRAEGELVFGTSLLVGPARKFAIGLDDERALHGDLRARRGDFAIAAVFNRRAKGIPTGPYNTFGIPGTQNDDQRWFVEGTYSRDFDSGLGIDARASFDGAHDVTDYAIQGGSELGRATRIGDWGGGELRARLPVMAGNRFFAGGEVQRIWRSRLWLDRPGVPASQDNHLQTISSAYLGDDLQLGSRVKLSAAVRYDAYFGAAGMVPRPQINPRLALIAQPYPGGVLKLMAGTAYRAPTLNERYFHNGVPGTLYYQIPAENTPAERSAGLNHLDPEKVRTAEFEHTHQLGEETQIVVAGYWSRIDQIIRLKAIQLAGYPAAFRYQNKNAQTFSAGIEAEVRWQPRPGALVEVWYAFNRIRNNDGNPDVPNAPSNTAALRAMVPVSRERLSLATELIYNSSRFTAFDNANPETSVGESLIWNVGLSGYLYSHHLRYGAFVDNLLDEHVMLPGGLEIPFPSHAVPQLGRTIRVSFAASF